MNREPTARPRVAAGIPAIQGGGGCQDDVVNEPEIKIRPVNDGDRPMLSWLVAELWGSKMVAVHGAVLRPAELPGFIAERSRRVVGLLTYQLVGEMLEIVTLNAIERRVGIGTLLLEAAAGTARHFRCREVRLTTTNDNVDALRFYQRRGFRLARASARRGRPLPAGEAPDPQRRRLRHTAARRDRPHA